MMAASPVMLQSGLGWLHRNPLKPARETAVLICPALNRDALDSHHALRRLGEGFAEEGYAALRFDYPGTGNAADLAPGAEPWRPWAESVHEAADFLLDAAGAKKLIFCGLRFGGLMAGLAAAGREDANGLLLLEPVLRGQSYLLQLWIEAGLKDAGQAKMASGFTFQELAFGPESVRAISQADLRRVRMPGKQVAMFARGDSRVRETCVTNWTAEAATVSVHGFDGLEPMLRHNLSEDPAPADFSEVLGWVKRMFPALAADISTAPLPARPVLLWSDRSEEVVCFGPDRRLVGTLCRPGGGGGGAAVLIANSGRDPQYGYARFGVELSRLLADAGIGSLRFDFSGLGESFGPSGREDEFSPLFEMDRAPDITAAVDLLWAEGFRDIAAYGLCSGAYHMLHGALEEKRLRTLLLVNLPLFVWKPGEALDFAAARHRALPLRVFLRGIARPASWRRFLTGGLPAASILRGHADRLVRAAGRLPAMLRARFAGGEAAVTPVGIVARLAGQETRTLFLYAPDDTGLYEMELNFGKDAAARGRLPGGTVQVVPELDHMLSTAAMRAAVAARLIGFLQAGAMVPMPEAPAAAFAGVEPVGF